MACIMKDYGNKSEFPKLIDIETCSAMKVIACIEDSAVIKQILDHLEHNDQASEPGVLPESRAPPAVHHGLFD